MIVRIALFKLKDAYCNDAARAEIAERTRAALVSLPGVRELNVGVPADAPSEKSWDLSIEAVFASLEDLTAFRNDKAHRAHADDYLGPRTEVLKAWNFRRCG